MSKRRGTQHRKQKRRPHHEAITPEGFVEYVDPDGVEHLIYDPELRAAMRDNCPICRGEAE